MEPVAVVKCKSQHRHIDSTCCCFCQKQAPTKDLRMASTEGKIWTKVVARERRLCDTKFADVLERLEMVLEPEFGALQLKWQKVCDSSFSSESKLKGFQELRVPLMSGEHDSDTQASTSSDPSPAKQCSCLPAIDWKLCMFCQQKDKR